MKYPPLLLEARLNFVALMMLHVVCQWAFPVSTSAADSSGSTPPSPVQIAPGPTPPAGGGYEGYGVAGSSRFLVIGRPGATVEYGGTNILRAGGVLVWELDEGYLVDDVVKKRFWVINPLKPIDSHYFGTEVAAGDRWIAVAGGQVRPGFGGPGSGATPPKTNHVQLIEFPPDGGWLPGPELPGPADSIYRRIAQFGMSLSMHRNRLVVGSTLGGFVYEVDSAGVWTRTQILTTNSPSWNGLGSSVAIHEDLIAVGAPGSPTTETNGLIAGQGGVIVYRRNANGQYAPEKEFRITAVDPNDALNSRETFGTSLAMETRNGMEWLAVGTPGRDARLSANTIQPDAGSAVLFRRIQPNGEWEFHQELTNSFNNQLTQRAKSGTTIALSNGRLAVGAVAEGGTQIPPAHGVVTFYYYNEEEDRWIRTGQVTGSSKSHYGNGLHGFEHGFLIGAPFNSSTTSPNWEWRPTDPYVSFINQAAGPFVAGTGAQDRRADADPDGDGILNIDEVFFGTPPLVANTNRIFVPTHDKPANMFKLQWQQATETYGLKSSVDWNTSLSGDSWTTNGMQIVDLGVIPGTSNRRYEARLPAPGHAQVFFRLLVD